MKSQTVSVPQMSAEEAEAKRKVEAMVEELQQLVRDMKQTQEESDLIGQRTDATLARLREKLGF